MKEIPIPAPGPRRFVLNIIKLVDELERKAFDLAKRDEVEEMERRLQMLVDEALATATASKS